MSTISYNIKYVHNIFECECVCRFVWMRKIHIKGELRQKRRRTEKKKHHRHTHANALTYADAHINPKETFLRHADAADAADSAAAAAHSAAPANTNKHECAHHIHRGERHTIRYNNPPHAHRTHRHGKTTPTTTTTTATASQRVANKKSEANEKEKKKYRVYETREQKSEKKIQRKKTHKNNRYSTIVSFRFVSSRTHSTRTAHI